MNNTIEYLLDMRNGSYGFLNKEILKIEFGSSYFDFISTLKRLNNFEVEDQETRILVKRVR